MIKTAVVILNWNGISWLKKFLPVTIKYSKNSDTSIFVADNGSTDGSADWVSENFSGITVLRFQKNHGFAEGYNLALKEIAATYFVLLNSDVEVTEQWLVPMIMFMDRNPGVASCQPKIRSFERRDFFEYAGAAGGFIDKLGYTFCRGRIFDCIEKDKGQYDDHLDIFWSTGACMVVRADAWFKSGGFDSDFFAHMEEVDLCWRFHLSGYRVSYIPESVVYHAGGGALPYNSAFKIYLNFRNNLFLLYKNLPNNKLHRILFIRKVLDGLAAILFLIKGKPGSSKSILKGHIDYYRNIKSLKRKREAVGMLNTHQYSDNILNKSIVFRFYIKGEKTFEKLGT
jgi:GT2 family glycosyltransferase